MKKPNVHRDSINETFKNIRKTAKAAQRDLERVYKNSKRHAAEVNSDKYTPEYKAEWTKAEKEKVDIETSSIRDVAVFQVGSLFGLVRDEVRAWAKEPAPFELLETLNTYRTYDIKPSLEELRAFQELAAGSFIGSKIVNELAVKSGVYDTNFAEISDIMKDLRQAEADMKCAITYYYGLYDESTRHYTGDQFTNPNANGMWYLIPFAADYIEKEDSPLTRVEKLLSGLTEDSFDILPSKRAELDETFKDADEQQKIKIAKSLINTKSSLADLLEKYDSALYKSALDGIADDTRAIARQAVRDYEDAMESASAAVQASTDAAEAARHAQGDYSL